MFLFRSIIYENNHVGLLIFFVNFLDWNHNCWSNHVKFFFNFDENGQIGKKMVRIDGYFVFSCLFCFYNFLPFSLEKNPNRFASLTIRNEDAQKLSAKRK